MTEWIQGARTRVYPGDHGYGLFAPEMWLNDDAINYHVELLNERAEGGDAIILPTFFYKNCIEGSKLIHHRKALRFGDLKVSSRLRPSNVENGQDSNPVSYF